MKLRSRDAGVEERMREGGDEVSMPDRGVELELRDVGVELAGRDVVRHVSFDLPAGGWLGVLGPNGAGKSTLLRAIAGLTEHRGRVRLSGRDTAELRRRELAVRIAVVAQRPTVPEGATVLDYVSLGRTPHIRYFGSIGRRDREVVAEVLAALDIVDVVSRPVTSLSGGEAQRVFVARALAQEPSLLLLDEPTTSLDVGRQQDVLELLEDLRRDRGVTVVTALHDLSLAGQFADRLLLLHEGNQVAEGVPSEVLTEQVVREFFGASVRLVPVDGSGHVLVPVRRAVSAGDEQPAVLSAEGAEPT
jgi:iron complex transport system ATP-binding protein